MVFMTCALEGFNLRILRGLQETVLAEVVTVWERVTGDDSVWLLVLLLPSSPEP